MAEMHPNTDKSQADPLGRAIADYDQFGHVKPLHLVSSVGDPDVFPVSYLFREEDECPPIELMALAQCRGTVLDVGAGAGSHSLMLQQRGVNVVALEKSELAAKVMQKRGVRQVAAADFFNYTGAHYDTLLMLMNGIGLVGQLEHLPNFFAQVYRLLKPGGQLLVDSSDLIDHYAEPSGEINLINEANYYGEVHYQLRYGESLSNQFNWLFVDPDTLREYAERAGFTFEILYESEDGAYLARVTMNLLTAEGDKQ